jgi:thioredoxin reductase
MSLFRNLARKKSDPPLGVSADAPSLLRIAILGGGPIGLEAALQAKQAGFSVILFEKGEPGENIGRWGHVRMFTPFGMNSTPLGRATIAKEHPNHPLPEENELLSGREFRDVYLTPLTLCSAIVETIRSKTTVVRIGRSGLLKTDPADDPRRRQSPFRLLVRDDKGAERIEQADVIFDCTGTFGNRSGLADGGIPAIGESASEKSIPSGIEDILGQKKGHYSNKSVLVIGGGYSAATTVCALADLAQEAPTTWTIWLTRGTRSTPLSRNPQDPLKEREKLAAKANNLAARRDGNVEFHSQAFIQEVTSHGPDKGFRVVAVVAGKSMQWEVDRVIANIGYVPDLTLCSELHVHEPQESQILTGEPNYFLLGSKSYGRHSQFLLQEGYQQVQKAVEHVKKLKVHIG